MKTINRPEINLGTGALGEGLTFRYYQGQADHPGLVDLNNSVYQFAQIEERDTLTNFNIWFSSLKNCDPHQDMVIAEANGKMAASVRVMWNEEQDGKFIYTVSNYTHPDWLETPLLEAMHAWGEQRIRQISAEHRPDAPRFYESWASETETAFMRMLQSRSYFEERYFFEMVRDLTQPIPPAELPEGVEFRPVTEEHYRKIFDGMDEAFRDHWGHSDATEEDYQRFMHRIKEMDGYNPAWWVVAWDGEEFAGIVMNKIFAEENQLLGIQRGWTDPICVRRPWRKRGVATAMINRSMQILKDEGMTEAALGVDTINPSGALRLYQNCGYVSKQKHITFRKEFQI